MIAAKTNPPIALS